jgi:hypothetical protein
MKYRVRLVRITMNITRAVALALLALAVIIRVPLVTVVAIGSMVAYTMLAP